jgi:hypothetical protein
MNRDCGDQQGNAGDCVASQESSVFPRIISITAAVISINPAAFFLFAKQKSAVCVGVLTYLTTGLIAYS